MEGIDGHSAACCNIPPVIPKGYAPKGKYETVGGLEDVYAPTLNYFYYLDRFSDA